MRDDIRHRNHMIKSIRRRALNGDHRETTVRMMKLMVNGNLASRLYPPLVAKGLQIGDTTTPCRSRHSFMTTSLSNRFIAAIRLDCQDSDANPTDVPYPSSPACRGNAQNKAIRT